MFIDFQNSVIRTSESSRGMSNQMDSALAKHTMTNGFLYRAGRFLYLTGTPRIFSPAVPGVNQLCVLTSMIQSLVSQSGLCPLSFTGFQPSGYTSRMSCSPRIPDHASAFEFFGRYGATSARPHSFSWILDIFTFPKSQERTVWLLSIS